MPKPDTTTKITKIKLTFDTGSSICLWLDLGEETVLALCRDNNGGSTLTEIQAPSDSPEFIKLAAFVVDRLTSGEILSHEEPASTEDCS